MIGMPIWLKYIIGGWVVYTIIAMLFCSVFDEWNNHDLRDYFFASQGVLVIALIFGGLLGGFFYLLVKL